MEFSNHIIIVTGAARGIGFATAQAFVAAGGVVFVNDLDPAAMEQAVQALQPHCAGGAAVHGLAADAADEGAIRAAVAEVMARYGRIDVLVNNAGIMLRLPAEELSLEQWRRGMAINLDGVFLWSQAVAQASMIARRAGAIVNVASLSGLVAIPNAPTYVASKHAVVGLTKALAIDWGKYKIRVNALCPGMTLTDLSQADRQKNPQMFIEREKRIPSGQPAQPSEQAAAALFLASPRASAVTGLVMNVDGGQLAMSSGSSLT